MSRRRIASAALASIVLVALAAVVLVPGEATPGVEAAHSEADPAADTPNPEDTPIGPLTFVVDESLTPIEPTVPPIEGSELERRVGVYAPDGGEPAELVLDEVMFHAADPTALDDFVERWDGAVLDSFDPEDDGSQDHLVRVVTTGVDVESLPADLLAYEDDHAGTHRASDESVLRLLALAASEWRAGNEVVLDWIVDGDSIDSGEAYDGLSKNVFEWSYLRVGGDLDTGVASAWQLLSHFDLLVPTREILVADRGFQKHIDLPRNAEIYKAGWGERNTRDCSSGNSCPWHGNDVTQAAIGRVDNGFGAAGPGGPVADSVISYSKSIEYWTSMRKIESYTESRRPDVVNLSFSREVNTGRGHAQRWTDRRMGHVRDAGALPVASAGNKGKSVDVDTLVVPCESKHVLCVGGYDNDGTRHDGSNYGRGDSDTSVEIWAPYCLEVLNDPPNWKSDPTTRRTCGTSFSSPFVAGVAMLVKAADTSLSPDEVEDRLLDSARIGSLGSEVTGSNRMVDALAAVASTLGVEVTAPTLGITAPTHGDEVSDGGWVDFDGWAQDFLGRPLDLVWTSDVDGPIGTGNHLGTDDLSLGRHRITATATDRDGRSTAQTVDVTMVDTPPDVQIIAPVEGHEVWAGTTVNLSAKTLDPDDWAAVPDDEVTWTVTRNGTTVLSTSGHLASIHGSKIVAGTYDVVFEADGVTDSASFVAKDLPPGQSPPEAFIHTPFSSIEVSTGPGGTAEVEFSGGASDTEDISVSGTRWRWTAYSGSETIVLCEGSSVPGAYSGGNGGFAVVNDCSSFTGDLGLSDGQNTAWDVQLQAWDSDGLESSPVSVSVTVTVYVP